MVENHLREALNQRSFFFSFELVMGRDHSVGDAEAFVRDAGSESDGVKIISATDSPGGNPALPPEAFVSDVLGHGLTPVAHLSGKDGNRNSLEGRLSALARIGVENVLALTGDAHQAALTGRPKPVYDLDSVLILALVDEMREGIKYRRGTKSLQSAPFEFLAGAVVNPYKVREPDQMMQYYKLALKVAAGARFIITQLGFDLRKLHELRLYMEREGMGHVPVIATVYVPTATVARMMERGDIAGCVVTDELITRLAAEKKAERLERAALTVAAVRDLGFAGAHVGGFGMTHRDVMTIMARSAEVGGDWCSRMDELVFERPDQFYLLPPGSDGLSDPGGEYRLRTVEARLSWRQRLSSVAHEHLVSEGSVGARALSPPGAPGDASGVDGSWRRGLRYRLLDAADMYRKGAWSCVMCGDCIQEYLNFPGCTMALCYKELRNGPCGGSRVDGACEVSRDVPCVWNSAYVNTLAAGQDPQKFAGTIIPPRDWSLNRSNAMANRLAGIDNLHRRKTVEGARAKEDET